MTEKLEVTGKVRFIYINSKDGRRNTIAYVYDDPNSQIKWAVAQCSEKDQFIKATGRLKASARLTSPRTSNTMPFSGMGGSKYNDITTFFVKNIDELNKLVFAPKVPVK